MEWNLKIADFKVSCREGKPWVFGSGAGPQGSAAPLLRFINIVAADY